MLQIINANFVALQKGDIMKSNPIYRKILFIVSILVVSFLVLSICIYKYINNFGFVKEGSDISVTNYHGQLSAFKLNDNEVFFLGSNRPECPTERGACWIYNMPITETPSEIYNVKNGSHKIIHLPDNILYQPKGLLLNDDNLLLVNAAKTKKLPKDNIGIKGTDFSIYKTLILIDLKSNKIIQTYDKKINKKYEPNQQYTSYTLLNNGKILIIDFENKIAEIYNPKQNDSIIVDFPYNKNKKNVVLPYKQEQALIFGQTKNNYDDSDTVIIYDDKNKTFKEFGHTYRRSNPYIISLDENKYLILGGIIYNPHNAMNLDVREIEIFDANTGTYKIINQLPYLLKYDWRTDRNSFGIAFIDDRYVLLAGGTQGGYPFIRTLKSSLIIDTKINKIKKGPNLKYPFSSHQMLKVNDDKILIFGDDSWVYHKKIQIFNLNKRRY